MHELIKIAPNGQWTLEKANNFPKYLRSPGKRVYDTTHLNSQKQLLTGQEQEAAHNDLHSYYKQHDFPVKNMVNPLTGKEEPHFLFERGINDADGIWDPSGCTHNMLDWSTDPKHVIANNHSVVASTEGDIAGEDGREPSYIDGYNQATHLKFWVPQSHVVGRRAHLGQHMPPDAEEYWSNPKEQEDSEANWGDHFLLRPGKFPLHSKTNWRWVDPKPGEKYGGMKRLSAQKVNT